MEPKIKHLELIQHVVNRMAQNSFMLKGWSVTLTSALFALAAKDANHLFVYLAYFPCAMFWALDGYFLRQERLYRALYDTIRIARGKSTDFRLDASTFKSQVDPWLATCFSPTLRLFHGAILCVIVLVMLVAVIGGKR